MERVINKLAATQDLHGIAYAAVYEKLRKCFDALQETGLPYSDHMLNSWLRWWEYSWAITESGVGRQMKVLDVGGTGTLLAYTLAMNECEVHTVDILEQKVLEAKAMTQRLDLSRMQNSLGDATDLRFPENSFDRVFCICVLEHIEPIERQIKALNEMARVLRPGGRLAMTFDFVLGKALKPDGSELVPGALHCWEDVFTRFIAPGRQAGLQVVGDCDYHTWHPRDVTRNDDQKVNYGSLLMQKSGQLELPYVPAFKGM
jgi:SAM-dependent methyltransferase